GCGDRRNRGNQTAGDLEPDSGSQPRVSTWGSASAGPSARPEYIAMDSVRGTIRLALRCVAGNCLVQPCALDSLQKTFAGRLVEVGAAAIGGYSLIYWRGSRGGGGKVPGDRVADGVQVSCPRQQR